MFQRYRTGLWWLEVGWICLLLDASSWIVNCIVSLRRYDCHEKDVHLLRKEDSSQAIHSFLGRGIIRAAPRTVQQTVSTPPSRFVYDRMLKV